VAGLAGLAGALTLSGCSANFGDISDTPTATDMNIQGVVHGGQQPLNGAHIYMYAASTTGYGGSGIAASATNASKSLLTSVKGVTVSDGTNFYVTTNQSGAFNIKGSFACTPGAQVYLYATGGDPQLNGIGISSGSNSAAGLLAVVGDCASATPGAAFPKAAFVSMNEVSTIAAAYALAGFATDATHIGAPSSVTNHHLSATGIANAFNTALNLVSLSTGLPTGKTTASGSSGAVPSSLINSLADILAVCVNSTDPATSGCTTLFADAKNSAGTAPANTATAAINIAQHPGNNVAALLNTIPSASPFGPTVSSAADFTLAVTYSAMNVPYGLAVDGLGNVYVTNTGTTGANANSLVEISPTGVAANITEGIEFNAALGIAVDATNAVWVVNSGIVDSFYNLIMLAPGTHDADIFSGLPVKAPKAIAIAKNSDIWIASTAGNSLLDFNPPTLLRTTVPAITAPEGLASTYNSSTGTGQELATSFSTTGNRLNVIQNDTATPVGSAANALLTTPLGVAVDQKFNVWVVNALAAGGQVLEMDANIQSNIAVADNSQGNFFNDSQFIAFDGANNFWVSNFSNAAVTHYASATGDLINYTAGGTLDGSEGIAVDGSGNVWIANAGNNTVSEIVGAATPVVTPLVASLLAPYTTPAAKP
jgi:streptogramin lyase